MKSLVIRNLKLYFYDKMTVFFSIFSSLTVIALYFLFLGKNMANNMNFIPNAEAFVNNWVIGGLLVMASISTSISILGTKVKDDANNIYRDFYVAPLKRSSLLSGYIISAVIISFIISIITLVIAQIFMFVGNDQILSLKSIALILPLLVLTIFSNVAMMTLVISFIHTQSQLAVVGSVTGMLVGFLTGIYVPIGLLPKAAQFVIKIFPPSHAVALFRNIMLQDLLGANSDQYLETIRVPLGINYQFGDFIIPNWLSLVILSASGIVFAVISSYRFRAKK